jgi:predicted HAD superfamily Cof-like phosphohydrolase
MFTDVKDFHQAFGQRIGEKPELPNIDERSLRVRLLSEEFEEYRSAEYDNDIVEIADALADIIYIACGTAVSYGIPLDKVFEEVHRSNIAKLVDGKVLRREDGKVQKPEGWTPPDIDGVLKKSHEVTSFPNDSHLNSSLSDSANPRTQDTQLHQARS